MRIQRFYHLRWLLIGALIATLLTAFAVVRSPQALELPWYTVDGGGGGRDCFGGASGLRLCGTIGQPDAGAAQAGTLKLQSGFWSGGRLAEYRNLLPLMRK